MKEAEGDAGKVNNAKLLVTKKYGLMGIPRNSEVLSAAGSGAGAVLSKLRLKSIRGLSGVHVVAVMSKPSQCPHGRCAFCPTYPNTPQSYTGYEPSTMRGIQNDFNPYSQVFHRVEQLRKIGHRPSKIELIIQGGTFPAEPKPYQTYFVKRCLEAIANKHSADLEEAKRNAETSAIRNVGLTVETRPDRCRPEDIDLMLHIGVTRVELGVQTLDDQIYRLNERGHTVQDVVHAFQTAKDAGLKIVAHMMPGLPGSDFHKDVESFRELFCDAAFKPDMLKIYPCLVLKNSKIYEWYLQELYQPYGEEEAVEIVSEVKKMVPPWVRIMRVQRDIPAHMIVAGVKKSNLRQLAFERLRRQGLRCACIRCREVGQREYKERVRINPDNLTLQTLSYEASGGKEYFVSVQDRTDRTLIGYLRLRMPSPKAHRTEVKDQDVALVRELHVVGPAVPVGEREASAYQHRGYGKMLLREGERIALREGGKKILVTSGLGVREYYRRLGYVNEGPYMSKMLNDQ